MAHIVMLQWGRGVSAAEIVLDQLWPSGENALQWGRGVSAAEIEADKAPALQWGRGVSAAEMSEEEWSSFVEWWLQWGRGVSAAEIDLIKLSQHAIHLSFNGAAAFQPRKSQCGAEK